jgi:hypothetical protein
MQKYFEEKNDYDLLEIEELFLDDLISCLN